MSAQLSKIIGDFQTQFRARPEEAVATFKSSSRLGAGLRSEITLRQHRIVVDEPESLGGADTGPNPAELVLAALSSCQEITYRAYASALGIPLEGVRIELEGDIDLRGFFAVSDEARPGFRAIRGTVYLTSSAPEADLQRLRDTVNGHCPVLDILANPVPVDLGLQIARPAKVA